MTKKIIAVFVSVLMMSQVVYADTSYIDLAEELLENNSNLTVLSNNIEKTKIDVNTAKFNAQAFQQTLDDLNDLPFPVPSATDASLRYGIIIGPMQADYGLFALENNHKITEYTLKTTLRDLIAGYIGAENTYKLNQKKYDFYSSEYDNALEKYKLGSISQTELLNAEVKAFESKVNLNDSERAFEGIKMNLNNLVGADLDTSYVFEKEEQFKNVLSDPVTLTTYALNNRFEIKDIKEQIKLQEAISNFYNYGDYLTDYKNTVKMRDANNKVKELKVQLQIEENKITREVYEAYESIALEELKIDQLRNTLQMQEKELLKYKEQAAVGNITEATYKELEFGIENLKGNLDLLIYAYNTKMYKLQHALYEGPSFGGGN